MPSESKTIFGRGRRGGDIAAFYTKEFRPQKSPVQLFRQHVSQWFFAAKQLRIWESSFLVNASEAAPSEEELANHRLVCSTLITFGEFATAFARENAETDLKSVGLSVESIEAETRLLRDNFKMFHDNTITEAEAEKVLSEAFHET